MPTVRFENIVKRFGSLAVLENLNLTVDHGEFLVLLGPSGCGKTTLLNLLAGLVETTDGRILIAERDVTDLDPKDRGLAMVFQSYALYPTKTVRGNLRFGLASQRLAATEVEARVERTARLLQIDSLMNRKPAQLSGGQRQRVAIGRALVKNADVLLFDEPLSNLDAKLRTEMRLEIKKLHSQLNQTVVYVTHDQIEAMTMATRIAVMNNGVIQQIGTPDEIYESPANLFVAKFIGTPSINIFDAQLKRSGNKLRAVLAQSGLAVDISDHSFTSAPANDLKVAIGLRPEHLSIGTTSEKSHRVQIQLPVRYCERTGADATAYLENGDHLVAVRIDPSQLSDLKIGQSVKASFPKEKLYVFEAQSGQRM